MPDNTHVDDAVTQRAKGRLRAALVRIYDQTGRNKSQTAGLLGIGVNTPRRKLESYGME